VTPYVPTRSFTAFVASATLEDVRRYMRALLTALAGLHAAGIVHRDVKSANIMVDAAGHVSIMDFGLALRADSTRLTVAGGTVGTPSYMSPEQVTGGALDHRTDIWSLGVLLYEMLTGTLPFRRDSHVAVAHAVLNDEPVQLGRLRPSISMELEALVSKALAKKAGDRWQSCRQFAAELRRVAGSQANLAFSMSDVTQTVVLEEAVPGVATNRRSPVVAVVAALAVLAAVGGGLWYSSHRGGAPVAGGATTAPEKVLLAVVVSGAGAGQRSNRSTSSSNSSRHRTRSHRRAAARSRLHSRPRPAPW
jgi:serine/threonine-protein kinase